MAFGKPFDTATAGFIQTGQAAYTQKRNFAPLPIIPLRFSRMATDKTQNLPRALKGQQDAPSNVRDRYNAATPLVMAWGFNVIIRRTSLASTKVREGLPIK